MIWLLLAVGLPPLVLFIAWASAALWVDGPASRTLAAPLALGFAVAAVGLLIWGGPAGWGGVASVTLCLGVLAWWRTLTPRSDREWETALEKVATARVDGDEVTFENVRAFEYRSVDDFDERWVARRHRLSELRGMDLFLCYWGPRWMAHTIASWEFGGGEHLALSIEVRKRRGETYSAIEGFFRRFELHYVLADERDVIRLRTNFRREDVYLYRLTIQTETARALLLACIGEMNRLAERPRWYNAVTRNCTTAIRDHVKRVSPDDPWDWRILLNGWLDELGYERGNVDTSLPFEELRRRSAIGERARAAGDAPDFSRLIREGLPGRRPGA